MTNAHSEANEGSAMLSIADIVQDQAVKYPDAPALASRVSGEWQLKSWYKFADASKCAGIGLLELGLIPGDVIAISSWTREEWAILDVGAQGVGLAVAGIYPTETTKKINYLLSDCGARAVIVENQEHYDKVEPLLSTLRDLTYLVYMEPIDCASADVEMIAFEALLESGRKILDDVPEAWNEARQSVSPETLAILIYTSGTTGDPKGAMISHANVVHQALKSPPLYRMQKGWRRPCYLPLCHVAERMFTYFCFASAGVSYFIPKPQELNTRLPEIEPNFILGVPRVYEKLRDAANEWVGQQPSETVTQYQRDLHFCTRISEARLTDNPQINAADAAEYSAACRRQRDGVLKAIGLREIESVTSGGAKFPDALMVWYWAHGIPTFELYGMSETGIISTNCPEDVRLGTTGKVAGLGQVKISTEGEVLVGGEQVFTGYLNKPEKNEEAFIDGWFRTGDVGWIDDDGFLHLVDRIKDILITGSGKNIAPSAIEAPLRHHALISDAVLVGEGRNYLTALIVLDPVGVQLTYKSKQAALQLDYASLALDEDILTEVSAAIDAGNAQLSGPEQIRKFRIIPTVFAPTDEEVTPTMKLKRNVIYSKYLGLVEEMYASSV